MQQIVRPEFLTCLEGLERCVIVLQQILGFSQPVRGNGANSPATGQERGEDFFRLSRPLLVECFLATKKQLHIVFRQHLAYQRPLGRKEGNIGFERRIEFADQLACTAPDAVPVTGHWQIAASRGLLAHIHDQHIG